MKNSLWIARDMTGEAFLYDKEPQRGEGEFIPTTGIVKYLPSFLDVFKDLTWENSPQILKLTNKNKMQ